ncbi:hypothetical protein K4L44_05450 [Halosquirtibacter laminarini]|uniref:Uncharacterized protein n=1 Tax=Halosquirtibacter laminarini TaxID=3374600 RepID=A0AC61NR92_9BACT|nr:hypothetical protein K4L44_05450 [Prolixibacteraceae bacterium]
MGTINKGILGGFSGKVGSVIGSSWKGIQVMRSLPTASKRKKSSKSIEHQAHFKKVIDVISKGGVIFKQGFAPMAKGQTAFNAAFSRNFSVFSMKSGKLDIAYDKFALSNGSLGNLKNFKATVNDLGTLSLDWNPTNVERFDNRDLMVQCLVATDDFESVMCYLNVDLVSAHHCGVELLDEMKGKVLHVYVFYSLPGVFRADAISDSSYCKVVV